MKFRVRYNPSYPSQLPQFKGQILIIIIGVFILLWLLFSTFYMVEADSQGVLLRFGRFDRLTEPGLHMKMPWPIETAMVIPVQQVQSLEYGFETVRPGRDTQYRTPTKEMRTIAEMLTGDLNLAHVEWIVQYRINDAYQYLFKVGGKSTPQSTIDDIINDISESVMRRLVGDASVDEVITIGRDQIAMEAKVDIQDMLDKFETGVQVVTVKLQTASPPEEVKDAFDEVNRARQKKEKVINEALGEKNRQIPAARGQRDRVISEAEGYRERVVRSMEGKVNAFLAQLAQYKKAPEITRTRLYLETMESILQVAPDVTVLDSQISGILPLLDLNNPQKKSIGPSLPTPSTPANNGGRQ